MGWALPTRSVGGMRGESWQRNGDNGRPVGRGWMGGCGCGMREDPLSSILVEIVSTLVQVYTLTPHIRTKYTSSHPSTGTVPPPIRR